MAKQLRIYEPPSRRKGAWLYPWDDWFNGKTWKIRYKEDFNIPVRNMGRHIRRMAVRWGIDVSVYTHDKETLVIHPKGKA